jgi:hypothetical protein
MKPLPLGGECFNADGRTVRCVDMTKLGAALLSFANAVALPAIHTLLLEIQTITVHVG